MVHIIDNWYFTTDGVQYTLICKTPTSKGKTIDKVQGYFTSLSNLLERLTQMLAKEQIDNGTVKEISDYITALYVIYDNVKAIVNKE